MSKPKECAAIAVLTSGGIDSAILCVDMIKYCDLVHPIYVRFGLRWEDVELSYLRRFLAACAGPSLATLTVLEEPVREVYGTHWSLAGEGIPDSTSDDSAVYLPGRNLLLIAKPAVWCVLNSVDAVALGTLKGNPFGDTSGDFDLHLEQAVVLALRRGFRISRPYQGLSKAEVMALGAELPLELTFSCLNPISSKHCGVCNKCAERRRAFSAAGFRDRTDYASENS